MSCVTARASLLGWSRSFRDDDFESSDDNEQPASTSATGKRREAADSGGEDWSTTWGGSDRQSDPIDIGLINEPPELKFVDTPFTIAKRRGADRVRGEDKARKEIQMVRPTLLSHHPKPRSSACLQTARAENGSTANLRRAPAPLPHQAQTRQQEKKAPVTLTQHFRAAPEVSALRRPAQAQRPAFVAASSVARPSDKSSCAGPAEDEPRLPAVLDISSPSPPEASARARPALARPAPASTLASRSEGRKNLSAGTQAAVSSTQNRSSLPASSLGPRVPKAQYLDGSDDDESSSAAGSFLSLRQARTSETGATSPPTSPSEPQRPSPDVLRHEEHIRPGPSHQNDAQAVPSPIAHQSTAYLAKPSSTHTQTAPLPTQCLSSRSDELAQRRITYGVLEVSLVAPPSASQRVAPFRPFQPFFAPPQSSPVTSEPAYKPTGHVPLRPHRELPSYGSSGSPSYPAPKHISPVQPTLKPLPPHKPGFIRIKSRPEPSSVSTASGDTGRFRYNDAPHPRTQSASSSPPRSSGPHAPRKRARSPASHYLSDESPPQRAAVPANSQQPNKFTLPGLVPQPATRKGGFRPTVSTKAFQAQQSLAERTEAKSNEEASSRPKVVLGAAVRSVRPFSLGSSMSAAATGNRDEEHMASGAAKKKPRLAAGTKQIAAAPRTSLQQEADGESEEAKLRRLYRSLDM
ncbi:hypothetical protein JCM11641_007635 [Rhodosporidiobolus odoratus]